MRRSLVSNQKGKSSFHWTRSKYGYAYVYVLRTLSHTVLKDSRSTYTAFGGVSPYECFLRYDDDRLEHDSCDNHVRARQNAQSNNWLIVCQTVTADFSCHYFQSQKTKIDLLEMNMVTFQSVETQDLFYILKNACSLWLLRCARFAEIATASHLSSIANVISTSIHQESGISAGVTKNRWFVQPSIWHRT